MCEKETIIRKALGYFSNYRTLELQLSGARFGSFPPKTAWPKLALVVRQIICLLCFPRIKQLDADQR